MKLVFHLISLACLIAFAHAASISPSGLPSGFVKHDSPPRNRTDFSTIFSAITKKRTGSTAIKTVSPRDVSPPDPTFFHLTFGPTNGANNAVGYMGFVSLTTYDVNACAQQCNTRPFDATSGPCIYFNIWTGVVNGTAISNICSLYNTFTDASTATNTGQGSLSITASRGYSRITMIQDGSFQDYTCIVTQNNGCPFEPSAFWTRAFEVNFDFILVDNFPAHSGTSSALFFFDSAEGSGVPDVPSTLTYTPAIKAIPGQAYVLSFFYTPNSISPPPPPGGQQTLFSVFWNGVNVLNVLEPANSPISQSLTFLNAQVQVTATGNDTLFFKNGPLDPHNLYLDDIALFKKWF